MPCLKAALLYDTVCNAVKEDRGKNSMDQNLKKYILSIQKNEITEHRIYKQLAENIDNENNKKILQKIAEDELRHYRFWKSLTHQNISPKSWRVMWFILLSKIFGISFGLKLMEKGERLAQGVYDAITQHYPQAASILKEEQYHEEKLLKMLKEERVQYAGSMVLGLNDALVELTGALAGLTFALKNGKIVAVSGLITGIAASLSMAASEYLSSREEAAQDMKKKPLKAAFYTGISYIITVIILVLPYFLIENIYLALVVMLFSVFLIVGGYTFYITTAKSLKFLPRFLEMIVVSLSVAVISFGVGWTLNTIFEINV